MPRLTRRQEQIVGFLRSHFEAYQRMPTIRELMKYLGVTSPNGVKCHLDALERKGVIERHPHTARGIRLVEVDTELKRLRAFKEFVHGELDRLGVPKFEDEECRIKPRMAALRRRVIAEH